MDEKYLIDLEMKITFQEVAIEELQQVVYEQTLAIDKLTDALEKLTKRFDGQEVDDTEIGPGDQKPPHY